MMNALKYISLQLLSFFFVTTYAEVPHEVFNKSLKQVVDKIEIVYNVKIDCEIKSIDMITVYNADWKFYADVESTLNNVLIPLNLYFDKRGEKNYVIRKWEYYCKTEDEGDKHLKLLMSNCSTLEKWEIRKKEVKQNMINKIGLNPLPCRNNLNPIRNNLRRLDGYTAENIALEVLPGVYLCGTLYSPNKRKRTNPAILCPHGHFYNKEDVTNINDMGRYRADQQKRCGMLARMGVYVFSYDMFAWGESTLQVPFEEHQNGFSLTMQTWNSMRVIDFFLSMKEIDPSRIGITGASGGGTQAFIVAALDDRITLSVPTVMVSAHFFGGCPCESGLPIHQLDNGFQTNNAEIAALFSPKQQLIISDGSDWTQTVPKSEYPYLQKIYSLYNKLGNISNVHFPLEEHDYGFSKRKAMYDFVSVNFKLNYNSNLSMERRWDESRIKVEPATEMFVFRGKVSVPNNMLKGIEDIKKQLALSQYQ